MTDVDFAMLDYVPSVDYEERLRFSSLEDLLDPEDDPNDRRQCWECGERECDLRAGDMPIRLYGDELLCGHCFDAAVVWDCAVEETEEEAAE